MKATPKPTICTFRYKKMVWKKTKNVFFPALCSGPVPRRPTVKFVPAPLMLKCFFGVFFDFTRGSKATYRPNLRASVQWQWHCERHLLLDWCKSPNWTSSVIHITKKLYTATPKKTAGSGAPYPQPPCGTENCHRCHFAKIMFMLRTVVGCYLSIKINNFPPLFTLSGHKHKDRL